MLSFPLDGFEKTRLIKYQKHPKRHVDWPRPVSSLFVRPSLF